ncbi:MAG: glycosyltransferase, partial [Chroococcales cyanobacterium]
YLLHRLRQWDVISANRVDYFIANSQHTARRIRRCYRREAEVIYPPVNVDRFRFEAQKEDFYLTVARLVPYKKVGTIVRGFNQLGKRLVVIGTGPELAEIRAIAGPNVEVLGEQPDAVVEDYMARAKAFVYAACEDFGIALVEAQACGTPVIAYGAGGALETVLDIQNHPSKGTGLFFGQQTEGALMEAVESFEGLGSQFNPQAGPEQAARFTPQVFQERYRHFIDECYQKFLTKA